MAIPTIHKSTTTGPEQGHWTYEDWLHLPDDGFRYEVIQGELFMSPATSIEHQNAVSGLPAGMHRHARINKLGFVLTAPVAVRLPEAGVIVQPDILFISTDRADLIKLDFIEGVPDLVVEILSPSNWVYDRGPKQEACRRAGVREYWIVDYRMRIVDILVLESGEYVQRGQYKEGDVAFSEVLTGFSTPVADIFIR